MKLPIYLHIEEDTIWTEYQSEIRKVGNEQELRAFVQRWKNIFSDIIKEEWLTEETLANVKAEDVESFDRPRDKGFKINDQMIREAAYLKWEKAGCPIDDGIEYWLEAERNLNDYLNMIYELVLPCKIAHAMFVSKKYVVPLNCAFIQGNGGLGEFEDA